MASPTSNGTSPGVLDHLGRPWRNGDGHAPRLDDDIARGLLGDLALPQVLTFQAILGSAWKAFWHNREDEALRHSRPDAQAMLRDPFLTGLLNERLLAVSSLKWHIEGHNEKDAREVALKDQVTEAIKRTPYLRKFVRAQLRAIWHGRYGCQLQPRWEDVGGRRTLVVREWVPVHGDKIGYTWAGVPYVLVNAAWAARLPQAETIISTYGRGLLLRGRWRERFVVHSHDVVDGDYFDPESAGSIHGLGLRHWLYWYNWVRLEYTEWIATYLERVGLGMTLWQYDASNPSAKGEAATAAKESGRRTNILVPVWKDGRGEQAGGVERVETPVSGVDALSALQERMEAVIERFVVGQSMSDGSDGEGSLGGSGRAKFAQDTKSAIVEDDAANLAETLTGTAEAPGLVRLVQAYSRPDMKDVPLRFAFDVEQPESEKKVSAAKTMFDMGVKLKADEVRAAGGFSKPTGDDEVCEQQQEQGQQPAGPTPEQMQKEADLEQQARQQELQHAQAKHEMELKHKEEQHSHDMRREATRTAFDQRQAQAEHQHAMRAMQQKQALAQQQAQAKAQQAQEAWRQKQAQQVAQQRRQQAQGQRGQLEQVGEAVAAYVRGEGDGGVVGAVMALTPGEARELRRAARRYAKEWDESQHPRAEDGRFGEGGGVAAAEDELRRWVNSGAGALTAVTADHLARADLSPEVGPLYRQTQERLAAAGVTNRDLVRGVAMKKGALLSLLSSGVADCSRAAAWTESEAAAREFVMLNGGRGKFSVLLSVSDVPAGRIIASHDTSDVFAEEAASEGFTFGEDENVAAVGALMLSRVLLDGEPTELDYLVEDIGDGSVDEGREITLEFRLASQ